MVDQGKEVRMDECEWLGEWDGRGDMGGEVGQARGYLTRGVGA